MNSSLNFAIKHVKKVMLVECFDPDEGRIRFTTTSAHPSVAGPKGPPLFRMFLTFNQAERLCSSLKRGYLVKYRVSHKSHFLRCDRKDSPYPYHFTIGVYQLKRAAPVTFGLSMEEVCDLCNAVLGFLSENGCKVDAELLEKQTPKGDEALENCRPLGVSPEYLDE